MVSTNTVTETEQTEWTVMTTIVVFRDHDLCCILLKLQTQLRDHISARMHGMVGVVKQSQVIILNQSFCNCGSVFMFVNAALSRVKMTCVIIHILLLRLLQNAVLIPCNMLNIIRMYKTHFL